MSCFGNCCPLEASDFQISYHVGQCLVVTEMLGNLVCWFRLLKSTLVILALKEYMTAFPLRDSFRLEASNRY